MARYSTAEATGTIKPLGSATVPPRWLLCDGSSLDPATYANLYATIGQSYGVGTSTHSQNTIQTVSDVSASLQSLYCGVYDDSGLVVLWNNIDNAGVQPTVSGASRYLAVPFASNSTDATIAAAYQTVLAADASFTNSTVLTNVVTVVNTSYGAHTAAIAGNSTFTVTQTVVGSRSFSLPDGRGRFFRGQDMGSGNDPDAALRTNVSATITLGDVVGSYQLDELGSHNHYFAVGGNLNGSYVCASPLIPFETNVYVSSTGGNETRAKNFNGLFIIRY